MLAMEELKETTDNEKKKKKGQKEEKEKQISTIDWQKNTKKERPAKKSEFQRVRQKQLKNRGTHLSFSALFFFSEVFYAILFRSC